MKLGEHWALRFDLKSHYVTGMGKEGLRFEKGGDILKDRSGRGLEGKYLVDRIADGGWELTDKAEISGCPTTGKLEQNYGVWMAGPLKRLFSGSINPRDVTPLSEVFNTPNVVQVMSKMGGLVVHSALSTVEDARLAPYSSQYSDACLLTEGHISSIRSHSNYQYDDMGEIAMDQIIKHDQEEFARK